MQGRTVTALVSRDGRYVGSTRPFEVPGPWWGYVEAITRHLDELLGVPTAVVRLLSADRAYINTGGPVTYHVEALAPPRHGVLDGGVLDGREPECWPGALVDHPLRARWARPGGPHELLTWAEKAAGRPLAGRSTQVKTWNLSCVYRLSTVDGPLWAKANAHFSGDEAECFRQVHRRDPSLAPAVLAADRAGRRFLAGHAPGTDCWDAGLDTVRDVVQRWVAVQAAIAADPPVADPPAAGIREFPPSVLLAELPRLLGGQAGAELDAGELAAARALVHRLPELLADLGSSGLPHTLVHGDLHPGNLRSDGTNHMIIDWAEGYLGHPAADIEKLAYWLPAEQRDAARACWIDAWQAQLPGCDPKRALEPMSVLFHLMDAVVYQRFLDGIEPTERLYHEGDPAGEVRVALRAAASLRG